MPGRLRSAVAVPNVGEFADPSRLVSLACLAESEGWDGFFLWDHILWSWPEPTDVLDPWTVLGAIAQATESITIGTMITPIARRRPWQLAREVVTLDHLSKGRVMFGVGLGSPPHDYVPFWRLPEQFVDDPLSKDALAAERAERNARYTVGLDLLSRFIDGKQVSYEDDYFTVWNVTLSPVGYKQRAIPILIGGKVTNQTALDLAAQHAGGVPIGFEGHTPREPTLAEISAYATALSQAAAHRHPIVALWTLAGDGPRAENDVAPYISAGVNWWIETVTGDDPVADPRSTLSFLERRIQAGPIVCQ